MTCSGFWRIGVIWTTSKTGSSSAIRAIDVSVFGHWIGFFFLCPSHLFSQACRASWALEKWRQLCSTSKLRDAQSFFRVSNTRTWMQVWAFIEREKRAQRKRSRFGCSNFCCHIWGVRCCVLLLRLGHSKLSPQRTVALRGGRHRFAAPHQVYSLIGDFGKFGCVARRSTPFCCSSSSIFANRRLWKVSK